METEEKSISAIQWDLVQTANGSTSQQSFGNTDSYGRLTVDYMEQTGNIGTYTQLWSSEAFRQAPPFRSWSGSLVAEQYRLRSSDQLKGIVPSTGSGRSGITKFVRSRDATIVLMGHGQ
jgi:hypothetical protein